MNLAAPRLGFAASVRCLLVESTAILGAAEPLEGRRAERDGEGFEDKRLGNWRYPSAVRKGSGTGRRDTP
jgi:hypothetical protein